jgi:hypothetical protein
MRRVRDEIADISLLYGYRDRETQNTMFENKLTKLRYPHSKHNRKPSLAVDFQPHPRPTHKPKLWAALGYIAGRAVAIGDEEGVQLRWGGDWDSDGDLTDQDFDDLFHLEIVDEETSDPDRNNDDNIRGRSIWSGLYGRKP